LRTKFAKKQRITQNVTSTRLNWSDGVGLELQSVSL